MRPRSRQLAAEARIFLEKEGDTAGGIGVFALVVQARQAAKAGIQRFVEDIGFNRQTFGVEDRFDVCGAPELPCTLQLRGIGNQSFPEVEEYCLHEPLRSIKAKSRRMAGSPTESSVLATRR